MSDGSSDTKLKESRRGAIEGAATVVNSMLARASDGSPNWEAREKAARTLKEYLENGTLLRIADEVIAEAEAGSDG